MAASTGPGGCSMKMRWVNTLLVLMLGWSAAAFGADSTAKSDAGKDSTAMPVMRAGNSDAMRIQGEQRFRANCGRCHASPQKFSPRIMKTVIRHMRVRATITDEDTRMILFYMTQ